MASKQSFSLWLKPPAGSALYKKLAQEVATQAKACPSAAPLFEPHVTLLGGIQGERDSVLATAKGLAAKLKKFHLNFLDVSAGSTFHRCVYILVAKEPAIMQAGQLARQEFDMLDPAQQQQPGSSDYMPHLSLLYAQIEPEAIHQAQQAAVQRLYGEGSDYSTLLTEPGFDVEAVSVWLTPEEDRSLASWEQIAEYQLS